MTSEKSGWLSYFQLGPRRQLLPCARPHPSLSQRPGADHPGQVFAALGEKLAGLCFIVGDFGCFRGQGEYSVGTWGLASSTVVDCFAGDRAVGVLKAGQDVLVHEELILLENGFGVSPAANIARMCSTAMRILRMIGFPPKTSSRTVIRLKSSLSASIDHSLCFCGARLHLSACDFPAMGRQGEAIFGFSNYRSAQLPAAMSSLQRL